MSLADKIRERLSPATAFSLRYYRAQLKAFRDQAPADKKHFANDHRPHVAVFEDLLPRPDRDAGSARMMFILQALTSWAHPVFFTTANVTWPEYEELLWREGIETASALNYKQFFRERDFKAVILSRPWVASALLDRIRKEAPKVKIVFDMIDVHFIRTAREAKLTGDPRFARESEKMRRMEIAVARGVDFLWFASPVDQQIMQQEAPGIPSVIIPTIHSMHERDLPFSQREHLLFVGQFNHRPNVDSVHFLAREVMPLLRQEIPGLELIVVGSNAPAEFNRYQSSGVKVLGYVPSLDQLMASSRVFVAPIRFGAGVNGKIGESLSYGLPVVTTTLGARGWGFESDRQVLVADDPVEYAQQVLRLYRDEVLWRDLSAAGYLHIREHNTPEVVGRIVNESID